MPDTSHCAASLRAMNLARSQPVDASTVQRVLQACLLPVQASTRRGWLLYARCIGRISFFLSFFATEAYSISAPASPHFPNHWGSLCASRLIGSRLVADCQSEVGQDESSECHWMGEPGTSAMEKMNGVLRRWSRVFQGLSKSQFYLVSELHGPTTVYVVLLAESHLDDRYRLQKLRRQ